MEFQFSERLKNYIQKTGKQFILVEVVTADTSDIEISEIAVRFVSRRIADHYIRDRHFMEHIRRISVAELEMMTPKNIITV